MSGRNRSLVVGLAVLLGCAGALWAQRSPYGVEEFNAYVDTTRSQDPNERLQAIENFLRQYPQSVLRAFVYPNQAQTAFALQKYPKVIEAVDNFMAMDQAQVVALYKQSNYTDQQIDSAYFEACLYYTYSFLQSFRNGTPQADALAAKAAERAQQGLELHHRLYSQIPLPPEPEKQQQFEQLKRQQEAAFHTVLAFTSWRKKDYASAAREYSVLVDFTPTDAASNYRLGLANLQKDPRDYGAGFWHVARAVALNIPKNDDVKDYLAKNMAAYQGVLPACAGREVEKLLGQVKDTPRPPADWQLATPELVSALRQQLTVKRIFDDLKAGGEQEELVWLASCGLELPELEGQVIEVSETPGDAVTLAMAITQEAADAKRPDLEVKVVTPPEAKNVKPGDILHFTGVLSDYQKEPQFLLKLADGKVNPADIPKAPPPRRRGGGGAR